MPKQFQQMKLKNLKEILLYKNITAFLFPKIAILPLKNLTKLILLII